MAISNRPWSDVSESDYSSPERFCSACLIDMNQSGRKTKGNCKLPVREPDGTLNRNAVHAAAAVLAGSRGGVDAPAPMKRSAARKLIALYRELEEDPPAAVVALAR